MSGPRGGGPPGGKAFRGGEARSPRALARRVLDRVGEQDAWATLSLDGELARSGLEERDRRLAAELVYGVLRHRLRLDRALAIHADLRRTPPRLLTALRVAAYQLLLLDRVPAYAAVDDAVDAARGLGGAKLAGFANAVLRKVGAAGEPPLPGEARARLLVAASLPGWILDELAAVIEDPKELELAALALAEQAPLFVRANLRRGSREALVARFAAEGVTAEPVPDTDAALRLSNLGDPAQSAAFGDGLFTVQDLSAQGVARAAAPQRGQRVLDACAGVGGKSTHLAELCDDAASVEAADLSATKLALLRESAQRLGLHGIHTHVCDLLTPELPALGRDFSSVILDAPCSGLGVLRRHPDAKWRVLPAQVESVAAVQARLLDAVYEVLAPGGTLVYSVCTFTAREGKQQIGALLQRRPELQLVGEQQTWPHRDGGDAFYLARLVRKH
ncbi:MAG: 16S rRNA (cytosine(967)-C(5))-methyltransferase RsmB [Myxococcales bacterium]|nr:16S rRNA (cytosine(967)-C(5))-methyltransferase RsmB [Myxococcales bacterium]